MYTINDTELYQILAQRIGIYYIHNDWALKVFDKIISQYPPEAFDYMRTRKTRDAANCMITFINGSTIRFVKATQGARGHCFTNAIVEQGIDEEFINEIVRPTLKHINREVIIL